MCLILSDLTEVGICGIEDLLVIEKEKSPPVQREKQLPWEPPLMQLLLMMRGRKSLRALSPICGAPPRMRTESQHSQCLLLNFFTLYVRHASTRVAQGLV